MKNPAIFYAAIAIGIVGLAVGIYYQVGGAHPARALAGLAVGAVLLVVGVVGMFMARSKAVAKQADLEQDDHQVNMIISWWFLCFIGQKLVPASNLLAYPLEKI